MKEYPKVSIGIVSYNRLYYLQALIESARRCIHYPNLEWLIVDGASVEQGMQDYLKSLTFFDFKLIQDCSHAEAMNILVEKASGEYLMLLADDAQFVVEGEWMQTLVSICKKHEDLGTLNFASQRRSRLQQYLNTEKKRHVRPSWSFASRNSDAFYKVNSGWMPINPAGVPSFTRMELWQTLGPWRMRADAADSVGRDSSMGAEELMLEQYKASGLDLKTGILALPVASDIYTDCRGTKARVRGGNRRYGHYFPGAESENGLYYRIWQESELKPFEKISPSVSFEDITEPLGFALPLDKQGALLKQDLDFDTEPYQVI